MDTTCMPSSSYSLFWLTSSSAVAKSPRDASCLSVVSLNSTKRRVYSIESFIVSYVGNCVQLNVLFCCFWCNFEASCHKHFVGLSRNQHRAAYYQRYKCHNLRDSNRTGPPPAVLTTRGLSSINSRHSQAQNRDFCLPHLHLTPLVPSEYRHPVWHGKTRVA